jgi:putative toxin-antitoxin system antitoxin component (TIGR02293 family)
MNPSTGETAGLEASLESQPVVDVLARAIEVFGTREKALRWLRTPIRALGDKTPISLLHSREGLASVQDTLGRVEHGVW